MYRNDVKIDSVPNIDGFWYLASPYSKYPYGLDAAAREIGEIAGQLLKQGVLFYCPIAESHWIAHVSGVDPLSHDIWIPFDLPKMRAAGGLLIACLPSWEESYGIQVEIEEFSAAGKPVKFLALD